MATVMDVIRRVFPEGTIPRFPEGTIPRAPPEDLHKYFPFWPPDMFAVTAKLVEISGCYTHPHFGGFGRDSCFRHENMSERVKALAGKWASREFWALFGDIGAIREDSGDQEIKKSVEDLQSFWEILLDAGGEYARWEPKPTEKTLGWWKAALTLLVVADEASSGIGFPYVKGSRPRIIPGYVLHAYRNLLPRSYTKRRNGRGRPAAQQARTHLKDPTMTLCRMVPHEELCVQPKATTPQTGCSLRSLTHHLALLPPTGEVRSFWTMTPEIMFSYDAKDGTEMLEHPLNLLLVPFPYEVDGIAFVPSGSAVGPVHDIHSTNPRSSQERVRKKQVPQFFRVKQPWLDDVPEETFAQFLGLLITEAHREVDVVHGVVLPELALTRLYAEKVAKILARTTQLELFITGTSSNSDNGDPINSAHTFLFYKNKIHHHWEQAKHHRWKLDKQQIRRYHLGSSLATETDWWENININDRRSYFCLFRTGATLTALVCEDLARIDPVQPVIRSVGPNLVIALLMDGPQYQFRWANRYATVLADDPGSAVLTLTSLGMVRRSFDPGTKQDHVVGLWKDSLGSHAVELRLEEGAHALLLTITCSTRGEITLDSRSDDNGAWKLHLMGMRAIRVPNAKMQPRERVPLGMPC